MKNKKWFITLVMVVIIAALACGCGKKITLDEAQAIALKDAGVKVSDTSSLSAMEASGIFSISFTTDKGFYAYQIDRSGTILGRTMDIPGEVSSEGEVKLPDEVKNAVVPTAEPAQEPAVTETPKVAESESKSSDGHIGEDAAYNIVLKKIGLTMDQVDSKKIELDFEDGRMVYEGEIKHNGFEYEFEVDAETGEIVKLKKEIDD